MIESGQVPEKGSSEYQKSDRIRASIEKMIESRQVPKKGLDEYQKSDIIWASTREGSRRVPEE